MDLTKLVKKYGTPLYVFDTDAINERISYMRKYFCNKKICFAIKANTFVVKEIIKNVYKVETEEEIYKAISGKIKEVNAQMPKYKAIRGMIITEEPLIKTTTNKIKRQANLDAINKLRN